MFTCMTLQFMLRIELRNLYKSEFTPLDQMASYTLTVASIRILFVRISYE